MVPRAEPRSYYGRPIVKPPVWTREIPWYFFAGGLGGASAGFAWMCDLAGEEELAKRAWLVSLAGIGVSPVLLISDLGRPERFLNMLRVVKPTSPMSLGSWALSAASAAITASAAHAAFGRPHAARLAKGPAALLGSSVATYTAVLIGNSAIPAWSEARRELPFVFGAGAAATAGAAVTLVSPHAASAPARRLVVGAAATELVAVGAMERRLGPLRTAYEGGKAGRYGRAAKVLNLAGAALMATKGRRSRGAAAVAGGLILAAGAAERWSVFEAGKASAADPAQTVGPQRARS